MSITVKTMGEVALVKGLVELQTKRLHRLAASVVISRVGQVGQAMVLVHQAEAVGSVEVIRAVSPGQFAGESTEEEKHGVGHHHHKVEVDDGRYHGHAVTQTPQSGSQSEISSKMHILNIASIRM